jgi:copper resistance protein B
MMPAALIGVMPLLAAAPTFAQATDHSMHNMPGMTKPAPVAEEPQTQRAAKRDHAQQPAAGSPSEAPSAPRSEAHVGHAEPAPGSTEPAGQPQTGGEMQGMAMPQQPADPHAGHDMSAMGAMPGMNEPEQKVGQEPPPPAPTDFAADHVFDPAAMAASRTQLRREHGGSQVGMVLLNLAEYQARKGGDVYRWDGEAWYGGDINRLTLKSEGEGQFRDGVEGAEIQALYSRALDPYWNLQAGVRYDFRPDPSRTYAAVGVEGLAPGFFEAEGALFLSDKGDLLGRLEGYYDQRVTQRLILQPRAELNFAAQDIPENRIGSGLSNAELGLRLRYEIVREFAPYVGLSYDRKIGDTARFARVAGEDVSDTSFVVGVRIWF